MRIMNSSGAVFRRAFLLILGPSLNTTHTPIYEYATLDHY